MRTNFGHSITLEEVRAAQEQRDIRDSQRDIGRLMKAEDAVEVNTEEFYEEEHIIRMRSVIMVERESQKGIIIGHKGSALKRVGVESRKDLEKFFGKQVHLELYVKVQKNWRDKESDLKKFGY